MGHKYYLCDESGVQFDIYDRLPSKGEIINTNKGPMRIIDIKKGNGTPVYYIYGTLI